MSVSRAEEAASARSSLVSEIEGRVAALRRAQRFWARVPVADRLASVERFRQRLAEEASGVARTVQHPQRRSAAETLAAEILPLADACRFLERRAGSVLRPRNPRRWRPLWLGGSHMQLLREPLGVVLILGPSNYPLFLPGVQALQALVAGNAVLLKPGRDGRTPALALRRLLIAAGIPRDLVCVLDESTETGRAAIDAGVDKVLLTGSAETGRSVLHRLAPRLTPATMELSGCDAVFVREDADLDLVTRALAFGMTFNGGATCIAPRRVFVERKLAESLATSLGRALADAFPTRLEERAARRVARLAESAVAAGARIVCGGLVAGDRIRPLVLADASPEMELLRQDVFAPVLSLVPVEGDDQALQRAGDCPYALGATVFGEEAGARRLASRVRAGAVVINDMIVPTADPRLPFGGRGQSGFGVTRGIEGLLELTAVKAVVTRSGKARPHFDPTHEEHERLMQSYLRVAHGERPGARLRALVELVRAAGRLRKRRGS